MNNEFNKEIIRLGFCLFVCLFFLYSLSYSLSFEVIFLEEHYIHLQILLFDSLVVISFILFFYLLEKTNLYFFSFYYHFSLSIKKKYGGEMLLWILFMDRCLPVLHGIHFTFVVVEEQFFFSKMKIFFFYFKQKIIIIILSSFLSIHTLTPSHTSITQTLFS